MSASLSWEPVYPEQRNSLCRQLMYVLRSRYNSPIDVIVGRGDINYLQGIVDCGGAASDGAKELIDIIEKNDEVNIRETW